MTEPRATARSPHPFHRVLAVARRWQWARDLKMAMAVRRGQALLVPPVELQERYEAALDVLESFGADTGDYIEFGVFNGTSMLCMHRALQQTGRAQVRLIGFDSFEGMPQAAASDDEGMWQPGELCSSLEYTRRRLTLEGVDWKRTHLVKGWFSETATAATAAKLQLHKVGVIMIDCDLYSSTLDALRFCEPLIVDRAVVFFDDWDAYSLAEKGLGERRAFEEFMRLHPDLAAAPFEDYGINSRAFLLSRGSSTVG